MLSFSLLNPIIKAMAMDDNEDLVRITPERIEGYELLPFNLRNEPPEIAAKYLESIKDFSPEAGAAFLRGITYTDT